MSKTLSIKGYKIEKENPVICVPVMGHTKEEIIEGTKAAIEAEVPVVEWRADYFEGLGDAYKVKDILEALGKLCKNTILLFTIRSDREGGLCKASQKEIEAIILRAAETGLADLVDVEYYESERPAELIRRIKSCNTYVVASYHNFNETPEDEKMMQLLTGMSEGNADICKIAVMPKDFNDTLRLMHVSYEFDKEADKPVIAISMGATGALSRIGGKYTGSVLTFAALEGASAPGQISVSDMKKVLEAIS